jgi:hypothetical protein
MTFSPAREPHLPIRRAFTWDAPGASGVAVDHPDEKRPAVERAIEALRHALQDAEPGTSGTLWSNSLTGNGYMPDRVVGRATRTEDGVMWVPEDFWPGPDPQTAAARVPGGNPAAVQGS